MATSTTPVDLSRRDLTQILTALHNRGDDNNGDPEWRGLFWRLRALTCDHGYTPLDSCPICD
jgi:hypothetical protein